MRNLECKDSKLRQNAVHARLARWATEIHIVLDNLAAHKNKAVDQFLAQHPKVRFHFTPTYSSWLNQVELWFVKIQARPAGARNLHMRL